jgi:hypothetical protein
MMTLLSSIPFACFAFMIHEHYISMDVCMMSARPTANDTFHANVGDVY